MCENLMIYPPQQGRNCKIGEILAFGYQPNGHLNEVIIWKSLEQSCISPNLDLFHYLIPQLYGDPIDKGKFLDLLRLFTGP